MGLRADFWSKNGVFRPGYSAGLSELRKWGICGIFFLTIAKKALIYYVDLPMMNKIADCPVTSLVFLLTSARDSQVEKRT